MKKYPLLGYFGHITSTGHQKNTPYGAIFHDACLFFDDSHQKNTPYAGRMSSFLARRRWFLGIICDFRMFFDDIASSISFLKAHASSIFEDNLPIFGQIMGFQAYFLRIIPIFGDLLSISEIYCRYQPINLWWCISKNKPNWAYFWAYLRNICYFLRILVLFFTIISPSGLIIGIRGVFSGCWW